MSAIARFSLRAVVLGSLLFAGFAAADAQTHEGRSPTESPLMRSDLAGWKDRATLIEGLLRKGDFKHGESAANSLIRDITRKITGGPDAGRILAMPLALRALARVGLKREGDALWDYQMTAVLWPGMRSVQLSTYGPTGVRLAELVAAAAATPEVFGSESSIQPSDPDAPQARKEITEPRALERSEIEFPEALNRVMKQGQVTIDLRIDATGRLVSPTIRSGAPQNALFLFSAMEGVRAWRFEPARLDGEPVTVFYSLTVNFH